MKSDPANERLRLVWSSRLENLAERLYRDLEGCRGTDPFSRSAVVVSHAHRGERLKEYHLFSRQGRGRAILAGMDVLPLHPFVGDWLYAALEGKDPRMRRPSSHPYSMEVLRWRIDALLAALEREGRLAREFPALAGYLAGGGRDAEGRRSALAAKLSAMLGDYQVHRPEMLARWEHGEAPGEGPEWWQAALWRLLKRQGGESLREQFERIGKGADLAAAFGHGIPRYASVHVFGVSSMPRPYVAFFARLAEAVPVWLYAFNPSAAFWMDDPSWRRARRIVREEETARLRAFRRVEAELAEGRTPDMEPLRNSLAELAHPLLGTLATGCQGLLAHLLDRLEGNAEAIDPEGETEVADTVLARLQRQLLERTDGDERERPVPAGDASVQVHRVSTPQREMEVVRDGLLGWFAAHPGAHPRDAMVLCADWETYAPYAEAVFGAGAADAAGLPCTLLGRGAADDAIAASFLSLLDLAESRMEAESVLDLLGEPAVAERFGIAAGDMDILRGFVREANIRWGMDDAHVAEAMAQAEDGGGGGTVAGAYAFTWRRGLDRLLLAALAGTPSGGESEAVDAGALGTLRPAGNAESERAELLGRLAAFAAALADLRGLSRAEGDADFWQERLLRLVAAFYRDTDATHRSVAALREAVSTVAARIREADAAAGEGATRHGYAVVAAAVAEHVRGTGGHPARTPDAVLFAPLRAGIPSPRRLVWICGLNDGVFPRNVQRPDFDLMGRHPAPLDPSPRDDDALALLEAVCGARETLVLSHVGIDVRSGEAVPPAPLAGALLDYLAARFAVEGRARPYAESVHPLQGFSPRYFVRPPEGAPVLPPSYSSANREAARALAGEDLPAPADDGAFAFWPADRTEADLDELADLFANPCRAVVRSFARVENPQYDAVVSEDALEVDAKVLAKDVSLSTLRAMDGAEAERRGRNASETGRAPRPDAAAEAILAEWESDARRNFRERPLTAKDCRTGVFPVPAEAEPGRNTILSMLEDAEPLEIREEISVPMPDGSRRTVRLGGRIAVATRRTAEGGEAGYHVRLLPYKASMGFQMAADRIRHLAANAAGLNLTTVAVSGRSTLGKRGFSTNKDEIRVLPPVEPAAAAARLGRILGMLYRPFPGAIPFHPDVSLQVSQPREAGEWTAEAVRDAFRRAWFPSSPAAPPATPEERVLWPRSPAVLSDGRLAEFVEAAVAFWSDDPVPPEGGGR